MAGTGVLVLLAAGGTACGVLPGGHGGGDAPQLSAPAPRSASPSSPSAPAPADVSSAPTAPASPAPVSPGPSRLPATHAPSPAATRAPTAAPSAPAATTGLRPADRLTSTGIGGLRLGMTYAQAERATGRTASRQAFGSCTEAGLSGGAPKLSLQGDGEVITRIDVGPGVRTTSGVAVGDSEARVRAVYAGVEVRPSYYHGQGHWMVVHPPGSPYELLLETDGTRVTALRTGLVAAVEAPEGCH